MSLSKGDLFSNFALGVWEADKQNTKENFMIRNDELKAKRNAIIRMKTSKYEYDINNYKENKKTFDALTSVSNKLNSGGFNFTEGENKGKVDKFQLGLAFLEAKHGIDWVTKKKTQLLGAESDPTVWNAYVKNIGNNPNIANELNNIDYKSRNTIEGNYLASIENIEKKYSDALKNAKNDSYLINKILGKKEKEVADLNIDEEINEKNLETIKATEINTQETTDNKNLIFAESKEALFIPKSYRDDFTKKIDEARKIDYSSPEYSNLFSGTVLSTIPNAKQKDYFTVDKDKNLTAKPAIINADLTIQSLINGSLEDANVEETFTQTGNNKSKINFSPNKIYQDAKNHLAEYGIWYADGKVLSGGSLKNLFRQTSTALIVPANSIINVNTNKLKGFDIVINKEYRKDVGKVYKNFIVAKAKERMKTEGGTEEFNINALQADLQNDNNGNDDLTKEARTVIAYALKDLKNDKGELVYPSINEAIEANKKTTSTTTTETDGKTMQVKLPNGKVVTMIDNEESRAEIAKDNSAITDGPKFEIMPNVVKQEEKVIDNVTNENVVNQSGNIKKISPNKPNQPVFESKEELFKVLPYPMSGKEIKEKYAIDETQIKLNDFTKYSPIQ